MTTAAGTTSWRGTSGGTSSGKPWSRAMTLYALRQKIGTMAFERVVRAWADRYEGESASTDDFIALASKVSGRNVTGMPTGRSTRGWRSRA